MSLAGLFLAMCTNGRDVACQWLMELKGIFKPLRASRCRSSNCGASTPEYAVCLALLLMVSIVPLSELGIESKNALHSLDIAEVASPSAYTAVFETAGDDGAEDYGTLLNTGFKGGGSESSNEAGTSFCTEYVDECPDDDNSFSWEEPEFDIPALSD